MTDESIKINFAHNRKRHHLQHIKLFLTKLLYTLMTTDLKQTSAHLHVFYLHR